jgi:hypothetical protein
MTGPDSKPIQKQSEYDELYGPHKRRVEALRQALDIRKFEIELYWKRSTYFWTLTAAALAGFFSLSGSASSTLPEAQFIVSCLGLVLSLGWYLATRGSKFWQANWERHVDLLEDSIMGPLYKTSLSPGVYRFRSLLDAYPISVSRVNQSLSLYVLLVWGYLTVVSFPASSPLSKHRWLGPYLFLAATVLFIILVWRRLREQEHHGPFEIAMERRFPKESDG